MRAITVGERIKRDKFPYKKGKRKISKINDIKLGRLILYDSLSLCDSMSTFCVIKIRVYRENNVCINKYFFAIFYIFNPLIRILWKNFCYFYFVWGRKITEKSTEHICMRFYLSGADSSSYFGRKWGS